MKKLIFALSCLVSGSSFAGTATCIVEIQHDVDAWVHLPNLKEFEGITDNAGNRSVLERTANGSLLTVIDYGTVRSSENCAKIAGRVYDANEGKLSVSYRHSIQNTFSAKKAP